MNEYTLKGLIDKLTSIYNEYGDIKVYKDDDCGGALSIYPELLELQTVMIRKVMLLNM